MHINVCYFTSVTNSTHTEPETGGRRKRGRHDIQESSTVCTHDVWSAVCPSIIAA